MAKRKCLIFVGLLTLMLLSGCIVIWKDIDLNEYEFFTNLKHDNYSSYGKRCAYYDGRVYFFSNQYKSAGIYSMNESGKDIRFEEVKSKGIRKMQVKDKRIYYVGYVGTGREHKSNIYVKYDLLCKDKRNTKRVIQKQDMSGYTNDENDVKYDIWDFYCNNNDSICVQRYSQAVPKNKMIIETFVLSNGEKVKFDDFKCLGKNENLSNENTFYLADYRDAIYSMRIFPNVYKDFVDDPVFQNISSDVYPYDKKQDYLTINYNPWLKNSEETNILQTNYNGNWLFTNKNKIKKLKENTNNMETAASLKGIKDILLFLNLGEKAYIVAEDEDDAGYCYEMDMNTFKVRKLYECSDDEYILMMDSQKLVTLKDNIKVCIREIKDGEIKKSVRKIKLNKYVNIREYKFEVAANWMFIYHYNSDNLYDLAYRINLDTGEIK